MRKLATHDGLTGLHNRGHMQTLLEDEVRRQARNGRPFCVAILDIDHFKQVNDRFGHAVGDTVLRHFAALGRVAFPGPTDILARWGGEEFLLIMPETTLVDAQAAVAHMRDLVKLYDWRRHHPDLNVAFSAGVCEHEGTRAMETTLELADQALYQAKRLGRDRIETARPSAPSDQESRARPARDTVASFQVLHQAVAAHLPQPDDMDELPAATIVRPAGGAAARARSGWTAWGLAGLWWGPDPALHQSLRLCLVSSVVYLSLALVSLTYAIPHGLVEEKIGHLFIVHQLIGALVPYAVIRSGLTVQLADRALLVPQMLWAFGGLAIAFAVVPTTRAYDLQIFCVVMVFGFLDLQPRQAISMGATAIGLLALSYTYLLIAQPSDFQWVRDGVGVASAFVVLSLLSLQSRNFALVRNRARDQKRALLVASEEVQRLMTRDALTGLFARRHMQRLMTQECERHARSGHSFCVVLIDLDHFKQINDTYGHQVGDEALMGFAQEAVSVLRNTDVIGRWGGEEFVLLLSDAEPAQAGFQASERLRQHVASRRLCPKAPDLRVSYSAGVAQHRPGETLGQLLERADMALYAAKARGRNCSVLSPPE
ncbi:diguanylate cyclase [Aquabacterium sp.]|uniref:GGDEF domain-containing protein n=1 Tax=Aquabacterium sp. TaxID=1872578 RepID=UPI003D6CCB13